MVLVQLGVHAITSAVRGPAWPKPVSAGYLTVLAQGAEAATAAVTLAWFAGTGGPAVACATGMLAGVLASGRISNAHRRRISLTGGLVVILVAFMLIR